MDIDRKLAVALAQYSALRRSIARGIARTAPGIPHHGGRDMLLWIEKLQNPNVTSLAEAAGLTRGGASKGLSKLRDAGLIQSYQLPTNRKEVYWRLTPQGREAARAVGEALDNLHALESAYIEGLPQAQKEAVLEFLSGFSHHLSECWKEGDICENP